MKFSLFTVVMILFFTACEQAPITTPAPSGTWETTFRTKNGNNEMIAGDEWEFNNCSDPSTGTCSGTYSVPTILGTYSAGFNYKIYSNGTKFDVDFTSGSQFFTDVSNADIVENSATKIHMTFTDSLGDYYVHILEPK
jgi:hypothetical protein